MAVKRESIVNLSDLKVDDVLANTQDRERADVVVTGVGRERILVVPRDRIAENEEYSVSINQLRAHWEREVGSELPDGWSKKSILRGTYDFCDWAGDRAEIGIDGRGSNRRIIIFPTDGTSIHFKQPDLEFLNELMNGDENL